MIFFSLSLSLLHVWKITVNVHQALSQMHCSGGFLMPYFLCPRIKLLLKIVYYFLPKADPLLKGALFQGQQGGCRKAQRRAGIWVTTLQDGCSGGRGVQQAGGWERPSQPPCSHTGFLRAVIASTWTREDTRVSEQA